MYLTVVEDQMGGWGGGGGKTKNICIVKYLLNRLPM